MFTLFKEGIFGLRVSYFCGTVTGINYVLLESGKTTIFFHQTKI